jgi:uncharacterized membrane protein
MAERAVAMVLVGVVAAVAGGLVALWPRGEPTGERQISATRPAEVLRTIDRCAGQRGPGCRSAEIRLIGDGGGARRSRVSLPDDPLAPRVAAGDRIRVMAARAAGIDPTLVPNVEADEASTPFVYVDFDRRDSMVLITLIFVLFVLALARLQGLRALIALALSLFLVTRFIAPSILDGRSPEAVAIVGGLAIVLASTALTHGIGLKSQTAMLGTIIAILLTVAFASLAVDLAHISGSASEDVPLLAFATSSRLSAQGLVLAGMIIAALGVLDDLTISQASTVLALRRANPAVSFRPLFRQAMVVGRDHLGATINTLALAYTGAALPVLLIFSGQHVSLGDAVDREAVAEPLIAILTGSIGLVAAVPITTLLAAALAVRLQSDQTTSSLNAQPE